MIKKLTRHGNSLALVIEKPILDLLKITVKTPLEVTTDGHNLVIVPGGSEERTKKFRKAMSEVFKEHDDTFRELAK